MKLLPDESVPRRLARSFPEPFSIRMVQGMGWVGIANGLLLSFVSAEGFDVLVTVDRGIEHQRNLKELPVPVIPASRNRLAELRPLAGEATRLLSAPLGNRICRVPD